MHAKLLLILILVLLIFGNISAQIKSENLLTFSGGVVLPTGDFKMDEGENAGYAETGFSIMLEYRKIFEENYGWFSTIAYNKNTMNSDKMSENLSYQNVSSDNYAQVWVLTGLGFEAFSSERTSVYGFGQAGLLFSAYPDLILESEYITYSQMSFLATGLAFGVGGGLRVSRLNFGFRYFYSKPEYEYETTYTQMIDHPVKMKENHKVTLPASVFEVIVGVNF